ncbi:MAG: hypothetical protein HKL98_11600 [Burkholderiales bacterium]|nr:hypothetical protein [Burkholderiales bacterium]
MTEHEEQQSGAIVKKAWMTPEVFDQSIVESTNLAKFSSPTEYSVPGSASYGAGS